MTQESLKYDTDKNRMGLMCENFSRALWKVGEVSTYGCQKYAPNSWQNLSNPKERYMDALCRHLFQHLQGEKIDNESKLLHLQHICWNALALLEFELKDNDDNRCYALKKHLELSGVEGIRQALKENEEREKNDGR